MSFYSQPKAIIGAVDETISFPEIQTVTGATFTSQGTEVTLTGYDDSILQVGSFLYSTSLSQFVIITAINGNIVTVSEAFKSNIGTPEPVKYVSGGIKTIKSFCVSVISGSAIIDGVTISPSMPAINYNDSNGLAPVAVKVVTGQTLITYMK